MTDDGRPGAGHAAETDGDPAPDDAEDADEDTAHLAGVEDGCGCAEVWEHLSERRETDR